MINTAIVLAAGSGTRLSPFSDKLPKPLLHVGGRAVLDHNLVALRAAGVKRVFINTFKHAEAIESFIRNGDWGLDVQIRRETKQTGPAGGAALFADDIEGTAVLVLSGDAVHAIDLTALETYHRSCAARLTVVVKQVRDAGQYGVADLGLDGRIVNFLEKPALDPQEQRIVSCGVYCLNPRILFDVNRNEITDFGRDLIPEMCSRSEKVYGFSTNSYWTDIGTPGSLRAANLDAAIGSFNSRPRGSQSGGVWVCPSAEIDESATLVGQVIIGSNASVAAGAVIHGPAVISDEARVGEQAYVQEAVLMPHALLPPHTKLVGGIISGVPRT